MKKYYSELEIEVLLISEDVVRTSNSFTFGGDSNNNFLEESDADSWWD